MRNKSMKSVGGILVLFVFVVCSQVFVAGQDDNGKPGIAGVWQTYVTPRNCTTGAPLVPAFPGILMFSRDGNVTGTSTAVTTTYGGWTRDSGSRNYTFRTISLRYDPTGTFLGTRVISQNVSVDESGNSMTTSGRFQDTDMNGAPVASGCATSTGTRFE
jgi:hypothetical protein